MKTCPTCQTQYPDQFAFCQKDGARLETTPPPPPSFSAPSTQPVARAVPLVPETNRIEIATQPVEPTYTVRQGYPATAPQADAVVYTTQPISGKRWPLVLLATLVLIVFAAAAGYFFLTNSTQSKFARAIRFGNLVTPADASAYDYYLQLKREGKLTDSLAQQAKSLVPQLTAKPQQMFVDLATPGKRDASADEWEEAQRMLAWASELNPKDNKLAAQANYAAGRAAYLRNRKDDALSFWKKAYEQDPAWFLPANGLGLIYNERRNYVAARVVLQEAIKREPNSALPYNNLGTAWLLSKDDAQAEPYYRKAVELAPNWPRPHLWLGEIAMRRKDYAAAVQEFELVLSLGATTDTTIDTNKVRQQLEQARKLLQEQTNKSEPPQTKQEEQ
jgi:tetratricopeptide (TPR) repeat protein